MSTNRMYHRHRQHTNIWHLEGETQNTNTHMIATSSHFLSKKIAKLIMPLETSSHTKRHTLGATDNEFSIIYPQISSNARVPPNTA